MVNRTLSEAPAQAVPTILPSPMPTTLAKPFIYRCVLLSAPGLEPGTNGTVFTDTMSGLMRVYGF
jgi:hypothetical protein